MVLMKNYYSLNKLFPSDKGTLYHIMQELQGYIHYLSNNPLLIIPGKGLGYWYGEGEFFYSADFGILYFHNLVGTFGFILIAIFLYNLAKAVKKTLIMNQSNVELTNLIFISCLFITTSIISIIHYTPIFHLANYCTFYVLIAVLYIVSMNCDLPKDQIIILPTLST